MIIMYICDSRFENIGMQDASFHCFRRMLNANGDNFSFGMRKYNVQCTWNIEILIYNRGFIQWI